MNLSLLLLVALGAHSAYADPVWDPTEIARLSEQTAQLGTNLSALVDNLQALDKLATEIGAMGARPLNVVQPASSLVGKLSLQSSSMPSAGDAFMLISSAPATVTTQQNNRQTWIAAYQKVAVEGLSLAQVANQDLASANVRSQTLGAAAVGAQDLRGDVQANSATCLAVLTELGTVHALLALLLEQQSLGRLSSTH